MKLITKSIILAILVIMTTPSFADEVAAPDLIQSGFYVGVDAGMASSNCDQCAINVSPDRSVPPIPQITHSSTTTHGIAVSLFGGYQLNSYLALETGWGLLPSIKITRNVIDSDHGSELVFSETAALSHLYVAVKGMYPLTNQFGLFGKIGYDALLRGAANEQLIETTNIDRSTTASGILLAAGASYNLSTNLAALLSYNQILSSANSVHYNIGYGALSLAYLF